MPCTSDIWPQVKVPLQLALACCMLFFLWLIPGLQSASAAAPISLTLQIDLGFDISYREGYWTPAQITIQNNGSDFHGMLVVQVASGPPRTQTVSEISSWSFEEPLTISGKAQKQTTIYVPFLLGNFSPNGILATVQDMQGKTVAQQTYVGGYPVDPRNLFVGLLADPDADFNSLNGFTPIHQTSSVTSSRLTASNLPTTATVLENFDCIILDDFSSNTLSVAQLAALQTWVNRGGVLIEIGGDQWQRTLGPLPEGLLPVTTGDSTTLPAGTHIWPFTGPLSLSITAAGQRDGLPVATTVSTGMLHYQESFSQNEALLTEGNTPLIVRAHQGQGAIYYLAFDAGKGQFSSWPGTQVLWNILFTHAFGSKFMVSSTIQAKSSGPGRILAHGGVLDMTEQPVLPGLWVIGVLLFAYLLMLGPARLMLMRWLKLPKWWGWRIFAASIVVFSFLTYGLAFYQKGSLLAGNSISLIQINQGGASAHSTTYLGLFTPSGGSLHVQLPASGLTQPISTNFLSSDIALNSPGDVPATITSGADATDLELHNLGAWTFHPITEEQDLSLHGKLTTHLAINNTRLTGIITNTLPTALSDVYILLAHSFVPIGHLAAGETRQVDLPLTGSPLPAKKSLADQIAQQSGLSANYFPYSHDQEPQTDLQRHMALLAALGGTGFAYLPCDGSCTDHSIISRDTIYLTGGHAPGTGIHNDYDPLLIPGASATFIGWADQPLIASDIATINGSSTSNIHDSFIQMPLDIDLSSTANIPPDLVTGQIVNINSYDAQAVLPGIYSLSVGSVTFEMTLPDALAGISITEPDLIAHPSGPRPGDTNLTNLQASLYNWQTASWDTITFDQDTFTSTEAFPYVGPGKRLLLQIASKNKSIIYFGKPSLNLKGLPK